MQKSVRGCGGKDTICRNPFDALYTSSRISFGLPPLRLGPMSRRSSPT
jgi:hypothetical protein